MAKQSELNTGEYFAKEERYIITDSDRKILGDPSTAEYYSRQQAESILRKERSEGVRAFEVKIVYEVGEELQLYDDEDW